MFSQASENREFYITVIELGLPIQIYLIGISLTYLGDVIFKYSLIDNSCTYCKLKFPINYVPSFVKKLKDIGIPTIRYRQFATNFHWLTFTFKKIKFTNWNNYSILQGDSFNYSIRMLRSQFYYYYSIRCTSIPLRSLLNLTKCKLDTVTLFFNKSEITFKVDSIYRAKS